MGIVDISPKMPMYRKAQAKGRIDLNPSTLEAIKAGAIAKGDPLATSEVAALLAVKQTPLLIPHCHPLLIQSVQCWFKFHASAIEVFIEVGSKGTTGVEMEALMGVSVALCTLWDMVKYLEKDSDGQYPNTCIHSIRVVRKEKKDD